ncbi:hypothetical protein CAI21_11440 [Alkalilimnicola ehrlichii]|uniref:Uncharacterized protein n=1 Tax=Alkalilimnicola ehrlichii TaxID=351052 RepID=A0A3E0WIZ1_9GAMM|nr:hypothetical protein CAI21_11440 [Alkalilimnicola ehrlichii]RFA31835.1 hypothetical protein CAL65_21265 [Alkalilimnicola ehrlichii]
MLSAAGISGCATTTSTQEGDRNGPASLGVHGRTTQPQPLMVPTGRDGNTFSERGIVLSPRASRQGTVPDEDKPEQAPAAQAPKEPVATPAPAAGAAPRSEFEELDELDW